VIRERIHITAKDNSAWNRVLEVVEEANRLCDERGWPAARPWTPVTGQINEIVIDVDYVDLAQYERIKAETNADTNWNTVMKPVNDAIVVERSYSELLTAAEPIN
jgi:hypothetical protein